MRHKKSKADLPLETVAMRNVRIKNSENGLTLRTRIVKDKSKFKRHAKHEKSFESEGFYFYLKNAGYAGGSLFLAHFYTTEPNL